MNSITTLIKKYQDLIKKETDYLASPEGQAAPEAQRLFATQKIMDWKGFVDNLEKVDNWIDVIDEPPEYYKIFLCLNKHHNLQCVAWRASDGDNDIYTIYQTNIIVRDITHWRPLPVNNFEEF